MPTTRAKTSALLALLASLCGVGCRRVLPGPAGGELANVNRWRGQLGLAGIDEGAAAANRVGVQSKAGPFSLYDFSTAGAKPSRMLVALANVEGNTWFLKMLGDAPAVGAARAPFLHLLEGLHVDQAR